MSTEQTSRAVALGRQQSPFAGIDPATILAEISSGTSLRQIADRLGVHNTGLRAWLLRCDEEAYKDVITAALTVRVAEADDALDVADDAISIARAREVARFSRMDLERRRPHLYGPRQHVDMTVTQVDLGDRIRRAQSRVIEGTVVSEQQSTPNAPQQSSDAQGLSSDGE